MPICIYGFSGLAVDICTTKMAHLSAIMVVVLTMSVTRAFDAARSGVKSSRPISSLRMLADPHVTTVGLNHLADMHSLLQGIDSSHLVGGIHSHFGLPALDHQLGHHDWTTLDLADGKPVCPKWGEKGWAPLCFLNGNPVFNTFDKFQAFVQSTISGLADFMGKQGVKNPYGPSIILFTCMIRLILLPLAYKQTQSSQATQALSPKVSEIKEKFPDDKDMQTQLTALLYEKADTNPLAGCLPAIVQIPVFLALYRSFLDLALKNEMNQPFLWIPNLEGPIFGERSTDWILKPESWVNGAPSLGWHDTLAYLSISVILIIIQSVSFNILSPPSDDPAVEKTQRIFKYLPLLLGYFSLSVPSGLGLYWITNNILSTVSTTSLKAYFKANPLAMGDINVDELAAQFNSAFFNPAWGYTTRAQIVEAAQKNERPDRRPIIPDSFA